MMDSSDIQETRRVLDQFMRVSASGAPPAPPIDPPRKDRDNGGMEARIAKLEAAVEFIQRDLADLKTEVRGLRTDARTDFRLLFGSLIAVALGLAALMAKGFQWI